MGKEGESHLFKRVLAPVMAAGLAVSCAAQPEKLTGPWESQLALSAAPEEGCSGRYSIRLNEGSLGSSIKDKKALSKTMRLEVNFEPRPTTTVHVVAQIIGADSVRSGWVTVINDALNKPHTLQTLWDNCKFTEVLWDGRKGQVAPFP